MTLPLAEAAMDDLRVAHRQLLHVVDSLPDEGWSRYVPYGEWTVKDLVAHCIGDMSPSGAGLILAGVLTPEFIEGTARTFDIRARNAAMVEERRDLAREDLRQMLFSCHDAMHNAALKLGGQHRPTLDLPVPMGPGYDLRVEDWLWHGYHDRQHADDVRRALDVDWQPERLEFLPEVEEKLGTLHRRRDGLLRAVYSVADDAWDETCPDSPDWTYKDILAHVASNDLRHQVRLRAVLGQRDEAALASLRDVHGWNRREVEARRGGSPRDLVDEMAAQRQETLRLLSRLRPEHLSATITLSDGATCRPADYVELIGAHESRHAGQLVAASRARRFAPKHET